MKYRPAANRTDLFESLPPLVECVASFRCPQTIGPTEHPGLFSYSAATLVWFQDRYTMPIAKEVLDEIRLLDRARVARDVSDQGAC